MSFQTYLDQFQRVLTEVLVNGGATLLEYQADARSLTKGYLSGVLRFNDGSELHFHEYVDTTQLDPRLTYAFHYHDAAKTLIFRYDNAAHRPALPQSWHKHTPDGIEASRAPTLQEVLDEIGA